jgi:hypothetical protein
MSPFIPPSLAGRGQGEGRSVDVERMPACMSAFAARDGLRWASRLHSPPAPPWMGGEFDVGLAGVLRRSLVVAALLLTAVGCRDQVDVTYGSRSPMSAESVNGTHVLSDMFESYGHRVVSWRALSPKLREKADVIVWFSQGFDPPPANVRDWLEAWLREQPDRTLIYVGRDFDAARPYLERVKKGPPPLTAGQALEIDALLVESDAEFYPARGRASGGDGDWFSIDLKSQPKSVRKLNGSVDWVDGIQPGNLGIELEGRVRPGVNLNVLLEDEQKNLVLGEMEVGDSRIFVVPNGSYLLNLQLLNREHRKLAGRLVEAVGDDRYVVFLESYTEMPEVLDKDPKPEIPGLGRILAQPPLNTIVFQAILAGLIFAFVRLPIFGVPKTLASTALSDFGRHVTALGELLMLTRDRQYAVGRVLQYQQMTRKQNEPAKIDHAADAPRLRMPR